jgi:hypothetical protein
MSPVGSVERSKGEMAALESMGPATECIGNIKNNLTVQHPCCAGITRNNKDVLIIA